MSDRILVDRIAVFARHGVHAAEEELGQRFFISLACMLDLEEAGNRDRWDATVCYSRLTSLAVAIATERRFRTIEGLAETIAREALAAFPRLEAITVRVEKPAAPVAAIIDRVAVEITRRRSS